MEWQPIETAPKDGQTVLIWEPLMAEYDMCCAMIARWDGASWSARGMEYGPWSSYEPQPTHWAEIIDPK